jgi:(R,R)-butanediol dehydrogenase/meso-butanediol dehydrogenase/diacetyl reductase
VEGLKVGDRAAVLPFLTCGQCPACLSGDGLGCAQWAMFGAYGVRGGFAEYVVTNPAWCVRLPGGLSFDDGALVEPLAVSLRAARVSGIQPGDKVLVMGAGAIGLAAAYWARRFGASRVAVLATSRRRENMAIASGATAFIVPEPGRTLADQCEEALGGLPDVAFDCAGMPGSLDQAVSALRRGGTVAAPGFCWGPDSFNPMMAMIKEASIRFTQMYSAREFEICVETLDAGHVEPRSMITEVVDLAGAPAAFEELRGPNQQCKVIIKPW